MQFVNEVDMETFRDSVESELKNGPHVPCDKSCSV